MKTRPAIKPHQSLTLSDVQDLGQRLIEVSDSYPLVFRIESHFAPLILMYLHGRVPRASAEYALTDGEVDFRVGGTNPALLELAVAPRALGDRDNLHIKFPGHGQATQLYANQNQAELTKLASVPRTTARYRYLLLLDLRGTQDVVSLRKKYKAAVPTDGTSPTIRIVYACRDASRSTNFTIGGKRNPRKPLRP